MKRIGNLVTLATLLFSLNCFSGVRVILGGGGFAEMIVIMEFRSLERTLNSFKHDPIWQSLTVEEKSLVASVTNHRQFALVGQTPLRFVPTQSASYAYLENGDLQFSMADLYDTQDQPKSVSELARLAWRAFIHSPLLKFVPTNSALQRIEDRLVHMVQGRTKLQSLTFERPAVTIHLIGAQAPNGESRVNMLAEFAAGTIDITEKIAQAVPCSKTDVVLTKLRRFRKSDSHILGELQWKCDGSRHQGQLIIKLPQVVDSQFIEDMRPLLYSVRELPENCEGWL